MPAVGYNNMTRSFGPPGYPSGLLNPRGHIYYVDASHGNDGDEGTSPDLPWKTMQHAFNNLVSGDNVIVWGDVREQLVTPMQIFDVTIIGAGNRPRHADAAPVGSENAATWRAPATGGVAAQATVRVLQQGWRFANILFAAIDANAGCIELVRNAGSGNAERDASHCHITGCRFAGAGIGIKAGAASFTEVVFNVLVEDCRFNSCTTAIGGTGQFNQIVIRDNHFSMNTNGISVPMEGSAIYNNIMGTFTTQSIKLDGGVGTDPNMITKNYLSGTYSIAGGYKSHVAGDEWAGNNNTLSGGVTVADPA